MARDPDAQGCPGLSVGEKRTRFCRDERTSHAEEAGVAPSGALLDPEEKSGGAQGECEKDEYPKSATTLALPRFGHQWVGADGR